MAWNSIQQGGQGSGASVGFQQAMIDQTEPSKETLKRAHIWDWFSGDALDSLWTQHNSFGSATFQMSNNDNGFEIITGAADDDRSAIFWSNIRPYAVNDSILKTVFKRDGVDSVAASGFDRTQPDAGSSFANGAIAFDATDQTFKSMITSGIINATVVNSSIPIDTNWTAYEVNTNAGFITLSINGILEASSSTNLPTGDLEPMFQSWTKAVGAATNRIRYIEAYNK